jgi:hypothetical protein
LPCLWSDLSVAAHTHPGTRRLTGASANRITGRTVGGCRTSPTPSKI